MYFTITEGRVVPSLSAIDAAGKPNMTLDQAAERTKEPVTVLRNVWSAVYGVLLPKTDITGNVNPAESKNIEPAIAAAAGVAWLKMSQEDQDEIIRQSMYPQLDPSQFAAFRLICQERKLSVLCGDLFPQMRLDSTGRNRLTIITTLAAFQKIAERTGLFRGYANPEYAGEDEQFKLLWNNPKPPTFARVGIRRTDWSEPVMGLARWDALAPYVDSPAGEILDPIWANRGPEQLLKCAKVAGFRDAFNSETEHLYIREEMQQADREQTARRARVAAAASRDPYDQRPLSAGAFGQDVPDREEPDVDTSPVESEEEFDQLFVDAGYDTPGSRSRVMASFRGRFGRALAAGEREFNQRVAVELRKEIKLLATV